ncbi:MAG: hypothetical protein ACHQ01_01660 [Candidatus Limnocylindrales bacterium]
MAGEWKVEVIGARELRSAFKQMGEKMGPELRGGFKEIMGPIVADIQGKIPRRSGRAAGSIGSSATTTGAAVTWNKPAAPYYKFLDFGGSVGRGHKRGYWQGAIKRDMPKGGRYVYPTVSAHRADTERMVDEMVVRVAKEAGFEVR